MLYFFFLFMVYVVVVAKNKKPETAEAAPLIVQPMAKSILLIAIGITALYFGGGWVVDGATELARLFGISESVIGLTIVAIGTSLPELVTSAVAAYKNNTDMAVGNAIGSNILIFFGLSGLLQCLPPFRSAIIAIRIFLWY